MKIRMVCLEDGIMSCGFRKMAAWVERHNADTHTHYVSTNRFGGIRYIRGKMGDAPEPTAEDIAEIARGLADADLIGFSSMTGYSAMTRAIIAEVRRLTKRPYLVWGGIHPIIHPEDAITADVDAICTGEGEFAFQDLLEHLKDGRDFTKLENLWFKTRGNGNAGEHIHRNGFLPLMTAEDMEGLPFPKYGENELIYKRGEGFVPVTLRDYLDAMGLGYNAIWSIGCPLKCTYCGNTKFIANDSNYRKIRHPSAEYCVEEVRTALKKHPHLSSVSFHDDSFMAIPYAELVKFAELWKEKVGLPFAVYGVIPNYVRKDKFEILTWAGMNRIRMGIQSGSERVLEFYQRPTPIAKVDSASDVAASFAPKYHIPPAYDIITDNPFETREDQLETLELLYRMRRPYTINFFSLKVIPNTELEKVLKESGVDVEEISSSFRNIPPKWANLVAYLVVIRRPPRWLFDLLLTKVRAPADPQPEYPTLSLALRTLYFAKRARDHLKFMDFSAIQGPSGYVAWRTGLVRWWNQRVTAKYPRPAPPKPSAPPAPKNGSRKGTRLPVLGAPD